MSPDEIRAEYEHRKANMAEHRAGIEIEQALLKVLQVRCKHPDEYTYYAMGEAGRKCPDCGKQT